MIQVNSIKQKFNGRNSTEMPKPQSDKLEEIIAFGLYLYEKETKRKFNNVELSFK